jgi:SAM-dependent methyltransferase
VTGYVLTQTIRTSTTIYALGGTLLAIGIALGFWHSRRRGTLLAVITAVGIIGATAAASAHSPCQIESAYYCIRVERDASVPSARILWLDNLRHSYVDLNDPTHLGFFYEQAFADVIAAAWPDHRALDALHIGGGGFTLPRYLATTYPGTRSTVLEIDPTVLKVGRDELGLHTSDALRVRIGDARIGIRKQLDASADLVVGDAFASLSVPWHLTTTEFVSQVARVLRPNGMYIMNVIDYAPYRFLRAEVKTLQRHFSYVAAVSPSLHTYPGGNVVLVASNRPVIDRTFHSTFLPVVPLEGAQLNVFIGNAPVIRDDFAPVDQWLDADSHGGSKEG